MTISKEVQKAIDDLSAFIGRIKDDTTQRKKSKQAAKDNLALVVKQLDTAVSEKPVEAEPGESQATSIEGFFNAVGTGVREAQESLDLQSVEYMRNRPAFAPETMFRVPKVSANLKLGMTYSEETGINFLVIKRGSETSRTMEQEISFDIVSAPLPPDSLESFAELPIDPILVTNAIERELVMKRLVYEKKNGTSDDAELRKLIGDMVAKDVFRRVLVIRGEKNSWTLMLVKPPGERVSPPQGALSNNASILLLPVDPKGEAPKLLIPNQRMNHFYTMLFPIVDKQSQLLTDLDRI